MLVLGLDGASFQITELTEISGMAPAAVSGIILNIILPSAKEKQDKNTKISIRSKSY